MESGKGCGSLGGCGGGRVDEGTGLVNEEINPFAGGGEVAPGGTESLAESTHLEIDAGLKGEFFGESLPGVAEDSDGVGFVEKE